MLPRLNKLNIFDDVFDDSFFGRNEMEVMKTDIKEKEGNYILEIDIPGFNKEDVKLELEKGYLTVSARTKKEINEDNKKEKYVHREKYYGSCSRTFYVGDDIKEEDIKANFKNGVLKVTVPKASQIENKNKKVIEISD